MSDIASFRLRETFGVQRVSEWIARGIPLPSGRLRDPRAVALLDAAGRATAAEAQALAYWPDGSVKWLRLIFAADVPPMGTAAYRLVTAEPSEAIGCGPAKASRDAVAVSNGVLDVQAVIGSDCVLADLGRRDGSLATGGVWAMIESDAGRLYRSVTDQVTLVESGARQVLLVEGRHVAGSGAKMMSFRAWVFLYPDQDWLDVEYQFIHDDPAAGPALIQRPEIAGIDLPETMDRDPRMHRVRAIHLVIEHGLRTPTQYGTGAFGGSNPEQAQVVHGQPFTTRLTEGPHTQYYDWWINSHLADLSGERIEGACHGFVDLSDGSRGVAASVHKYGQNWPKGLQALQDRIIVEIVPESSHVLHAFQGQARTTKARIWLHEGDMRAAGIHGKHLAYSRPLHIDSPQTFLESGALPRLMPFQPDRYPKLEDRFFREWDQMRLLQRALGMMDYGDHRQLSSQTWGRPAFWANNEHDLGYAFFLQYARTGYRQFLDEALAAWEHWMDVDTVHFSENPVEIGGWRTHGARHVLYAPGSQTSCYTSHAWAEGPIHLYLLTGHPAALEAVRRLGDWLCAVCDAPEGAPYAQGHATGDRDRGWPLLALSALHETFGDEKYLRAARRLAELYITGPDAISEAGNVAVQYCTMRISNGREGMKIVALGLGRYYRISRDERFKELFLRVCRWLVSPESGGLVWDMQGSDQTGLNQVMNGGWREVLGQAYELTGDRTFIEAGLRGIERAMPSTRPLGGIHAPVVTPEGNVVIADADFASNLWRDLLPYLAYADELGVLEDF